MTIGGRLKKAWGAFRAGTYQNPDEWMWETFGASKTLAGVSISERNSLNLGPVFACVSKISKTVGSLPLPVYEKTKNGKEKAESHPVYEILHDRPNPEMSAMVFREALQAHVLQWGNAYAEIERQNSGRVRALWPIAPDKCSPMRDDTGRLWYRISQEKGGYSYLRPDQVLHVPGLGFDGLIGYSVVRMARESMGLTLAAEQFGSAFFGNGASMGGFLTHPATPTPDQVEALRKAVNDGHQGVANAHKLGILTGGMTYSPKSIPPDDAQFLETRKFQVVDIARWFDVPPHKIASMDAATFGNIEHQAIEWVVDTIRPWCVRWEQEINRKLFSESERKKYFAKHVIDGLLRGDYKSRMEGYNIGRNGGWMSANDIRELEDQNRIDNGDLYLVPVNMQPVEKAIAPDPEPQPSQPPQNDDQDDMATALATRYARKEAKAIANGYQKHRGNHAAFWAWFDKFIDRHTADLASAFGLDPQAYAYDLRGLLSHDPDSLSIDDIELTALGRILAMRATQ